jgi:hypothetical protein
MVAEVQVSVGGKLATFLKPENLETSDGWYRGSVVNFFPRERERTAERDPEEIFRHVLKGWVPDKPFISKDDFITAFGSCFAAHVEKHLRGRGYRTSIGEYGNAEYDNYWAQSLFIKCGEGIVNTFALRSQFEFIFENDLPELRVWLKSEGAIREYIDSNKEAARDVFNRTSVFVITLGLSEVWYNKQTGAVLWTAVPKSMFDPGVHGFRVATAQENYENLNRIVDLVRAHRGDVPIIFTLSPVPLNATFRPISCITASSASKARLRVAVDDLMIERASDKNLYYFPSYEIVTSYLDRPWSEDGIHPSEHTVGTIMQAFAHYFCRE